MTKMLNIGTSRPKLNVKNWSANRQWSKQLNLMLRLRKLSWEPLLNKKPNWREKFWRRRLNLQSKNKRNILWMKWNLIFKKCRGSRSSWRSRGSESRNRSALNSWKVLVQMAKRSKSSSQKWLLTLRRKPWISWLPNLDYNPLFLFWA